MLHCTEHRQDLETKWHHCSNATLQCHMTMALSQTEISISTWMWETWVPPCVKRRARWKWKGQQPPGIEPRAPGFVQPVLCNISTYRRVVRVGGCLVVVATQLWKIPPVKFYYTVFKPGGIWFKFQPLMISHFSLFYLLPMFIYHEIEVNWSIVWN